MDEERLIDWYGVVEAVANGRRDNHACPECGHQPLETSGSGSRVRVHCPGCGQGFEGALGYGRDDGLYAEADALIARQATARRPIPEPAEAAEGTAVAAPSAPGPSAPARAPDSARTRPAPWGWSLPAGAGADDLDALSVWMEVVTALHNGRRTGLRCPYCSEQLTDIVVQDPHLRVRCHVCGETFEGAVR
jgi:ribosomal protein S27E